MQCVFDAFCVVVGATAAEITCWGPADWLVQLLCV